VGRPLVSWVARVARVVASLATVPASADGDGAHEADAQRLFDEARDLMAKGRFAEACGMLERSEAQDPGIGTEFNLARCYDLAGRLASARAMYRRVIEETVEAGQRDRETVARGLSAGLEKRVVRIALHVASPAVALEIRVDGNLVPQMDWATPLEVDPGPHEVEATAPDFSPWRTVVRALHEGDTVGVDVPPLVSRAAVQPVAAAPLRESPAPVVAGTGGGFGSQRIVALGLGALGLGALVPATYFGAQAISLESQAGPLCRINGAECDPTGYDDRQRSLSAGNASTVSFVVGGVLLAAAGVVWFTAPHRP
jgi:hypothetical protein